MSVEELWEIEDEEETQIVSTRAVSGVRPRIALVLCSIAVGVFLVGYALGGAYAQTPPAPTPAPPRTVFEAVSREVEALAGGDIAAFLALQDPDDAAWVVTQRAEFEAWGEPPMGGRLYVVVDSGTLSNGLTWVDLRQYRAGEYVRQTRFYRPRDGAWVRARPAAAFYATQRTFETVHFSVEFEPGDRDEARAMAAQFERAYSRLCIDLGCRAGPGNYRDDVFGSSPFPRVLNITLRLRDGAPRATMIDQGQWVTLTLPAPRLPQPDQTDAEIDRFAYDSLVVPTARIASGGTARWSARNDGELIIRAVVTWERNRLLVDPRLQPTLAQAYGSLQDENLLPLRVLWSWPIQFPPNASVLNLMRRQASALIAYIEDAYGTARVSSLLRAFDGAESLQQAVEAGLGIPYRSFERDWRAWLGRIKDPPH